MAGAAVPVRDINQQTRAIRNEDARAVVQLADLAAISDEFSAADAVLVESGAAWGTPIHVLGVDHLLVAVDYVEGTDTDAVVLVAQVGDSKNPTGEWFDVAEDDGTGDVLRKAWTVAFATSPGAVAFKLPVPGGTWMRFKAFANGTNATNSRITVRARRHMSAR